ncbi:hypothetical protein ITJ46_07325 [Rathayibacter sp. VKM Ac-2878]|nr:hypothetical protein [Rathayibacter sp. VKM Ac-2879]MBF4503747.1 hypothetical protein [Rathayibacter sp. VKM Ac-2878]
MARRARTVLLDGPSGSGKSTFARQMLLALRDAHAPEAELVHMDDLYRGWSGLAEAADLVARSLVRSHSLGQPAHWRPWNWASGTTAGTRMVRAPILLLEGCGAASAASRAAADVTLWLEADEGERKRRALARDGDLFAPHWEVWDDQFRAYCARERPREGADLVLDSSDPRR